MRVLLLALALVQAAEPEKLTNPVCYDTVAAFVAERNRSPDPKRHILSVEALIPYLPDAYFEADRFGLVYETHSKQGATPERPRVILAGRQSRSLLAYATDPKLKGFNSLEFADWDDSSKRWVFRAIQFPLKAGDKVEFSERNPQRCLDCHGRPSPRPNWETYGVWSGFYGSSHTELPKRESEGWKKFDAIRKTDPFYRRMKFKRFPADKDDDSFLVAEMTGSNAGIGFELDELNAHRIARQIALTPAVFPLRYAVLAALAECPDYLQALPESLRAAGAKEAKATAERLTHAIRREMRQRFQRQGVKYDPVTWEPDKRFVYLQTILALAGGVDSRDWSLSFRERETMFDGSWSRRTFSNYPGGRTEDTVYDHLVREWKITGFDVYLEKARRQFKTDDGQPYEIRDVDPNCAELVKRGAKEPLERKVTPVPPLKPASTH